MQFFFFLWIKRGCIKIARVALQSLVLILLDYPSLWKRHVNTVFLNIFSQQPVEMSIFSVSKLESILSQLANDFGGKYIL